MGAVVIRGFDGQELRVTHEDFKKYGKPDVFGRLEIKLSKKWSTMTGDRQIALSHSGDIDVEEKEFKGHNAYYGDVHGTMQMFAKTNENSRVHTMRFPDGQVLEIFHECGNLTIIEGVAKAQPEQIEKPKQENKENWFNFFRRK